MRAALAAILPLAVVAGQGCLEEDVWREGGAELEQLSLGSAVACQRRCRHTEGCSHFNYQWSTCHLLTDLGKVSLRPGAVSGPRVCEHCDQSNTALWQPDTVLELAILSTNTGPECAQLCTESPDCLYYTWYSSDMFCELHSEMGKATALRGATAGPRMCETCMEYSINYENKDDIGSASAQESAAECNRQCVRVSTCSFWAWNQESHECRIKASDAGRTEDVNYISGPRVCGEQACMQRDWNYAGGDLLATLPDVKSAQRCAASCAQASGCEVYTYIPHADICTLKRATTAAPLWGQQSQSHVSGPGTCRPSSTKPALERRLWWDRRRRARRRRTRRRRTRRRRTRRRRTRRRRTRRRRTRRRRTRRRRTRRRRTRRRRTRRRRTTTTSTATITETSSTETSSTSTVTTLTSTSTSLTTSTSSSTTSTTTSSTTSTTATTSTSTTTSATSTTSTSTTTTTSTTSTSTISTTTTSTTSTSTATATSTTSTSTTSTTTISTTSTSTTTTTSTTSTSTTSTTTSSTTSTTTTTSTSTTTSTTSTTSTSITTTTSTTSTSTTSTTTSSTTSTTTTTSTSTTKSTTTTTSTTTSTTTTLTTTTTTTGTTTSTLANQSVPAQFLVATGRSDCLDDALFVDELGLRCGDWEGGNCSASARYTKEQLIRVQAKCPIACGLCSGSTAAPVIIQTASAVTGSISTKVNVSGGLEAAQKTFAQAFAATFNVPTENVFVTLEIQEISGRRLTGVQEAVVRYEVVTPPDTQVRDIMLKANAMLAPGSAENSAFLGSLDEGVLSGDASLTAVSLPSKSTVEVVLDENGVMVGGQGAGGGTESTVTAVPGCADTPGYIDELGDGCSGWVGYECRDPKWLSTEKPYSISGLLSVQKNCLLSCGLCIRSGRKTSAQLLDECSDDADIVLWCLRWRGLNCSLAQALGFSKTYAQRLIERCPLSCGFCEGEADFCMDSPSFSDELGYSCGSWSGFDCTRLYSGYSRMGMLDVQAVCPRSCGFCVEPAAAPEAGPAATCEDNAEFRILKQFMCTDFVGKTCTYSTIFLEPRWLLGPQAAYKWHQELWSNCPVSCDLCVVPGRPTTSDLLLECEDDPIWGSWCSYIMRGEACANWPSTTMLANLYDFNRFNRTLFETCPWTCGLCTPPTCPPSTFRDRSLHACEHCPPGRFAPQLTAGKAAVVACVAARPGFAVPERGATEELPCDMGTFARYSGSSACIPCPPGRFGGVRGMRRCEPCAAGYHQDSPGAISCLRCAHGTFINSTNSKRCRSCPPSYSTMLEASTALDLCMCPAGKYLPDDGSRCIACPSGFTCPGGHSYISDGLDRTVLLKPGVMSLPGTPLSGYFCKGKDTLCKESRRPPFTEASFAEVCPNERHGPQCFLCPDGYYQQGLECLSCGDGSFFSQGWLLFLTFGLQLWVIFKLYSKQGKKKTPFRVMVWEAIAFLQVLSSFKSLPCNWPAPIQGVLFKFTDFFSFEIGFRITRFQHECHFGGSLLSQVLRDVSLPLLPFLNFAVIGLLYKLCRKSLMSHWVCNVIAILYCGFFINICILAVQLFPTTEMPNGKLYVTAKPGVEFGSEEWLTALPIALLAVLVYCVGFIAYVVFGILKLPSEVAKKGSTFGKRYGFLMKGMRPEAFGWKLSQLAFALSIALVKALTTNVYAKLQLTILVTLLFIVAECLVQPRKVIAVFQLAVALKLALILFASFAATYLDRDAVDVHAQRRPVTWLMLFAVGLSALVTALACAKSVQWRKHASSAKSKARENWVMALRCRIAMHELVVMREKQFLASVRQMFDYERLQLERTSRMILAIFFKCQASKRRRTIVRGASEYVVHDPKAAYEGLRRSIHGGEFAQHLETRDKASQLLGLLNEHMRPPDGKEHETLDHAAFVEMLAQRTDVPKEELLQLFRDCGLEEYSARGIKDLMGAVNVASSCSGRKEGRDYHVLARGRAATPTLRGSTEFVVARDVGGGAKTRIVWDTDVGTIMSPR